ncbi:MAG: EutN/CcmL family microcompartment protein [Planctomycetia bacterium]|nr:EutN/CcmL family microcompartment protein [Planctomycetia bacterium]
MRIGKVIGTVTAAPLHEKLVGGQFKIVAPFSLNDLAPQDSEEGGRLTGQETLDELRERIAATQPSFRGDELVVYDDLNAGVGEWVAFSEGAEAAMAYYPNMKPVDACAAAIINTLELDHAALARLERGK